MPDLIRLYIQSVVIGVCLAAAFVAMLVWFDVGGLQSLVLGSDMGWIALIMLTVSHGIVFAGTQFGIRVMMMAEGGDGPRGGRTRRTAPWGVPIPVRVTGQVRSTHRPRRRA
jgi:hypothetical protein